MRVHMEEFQRCLRGADVWDIRPRSGWFSWASGTRAKTFVCERIDRFVAKIKWRLLFPEYFVDTVPMASFDHSAISLSLEGAITNSSPRRDYFKFDACWANKDQYRDIVHRVWENNEDSFSVKVGKIGLYSGPISNEFCELRRKALADLKDVMDKDEMFWLQRFRVAWLKDGDRWRIFLVLLRATFPLSFVLPKRLPTRRSIKPLIDVSRHVITRCFDETFLPRSLLNGTMDFNYANRTIIVLIPKGLSALLLKAQRRNEIKGIIASMRGLRITHLLYADDSLLFVKNSTAEVRKVKSILAQYEKASGQKVNYEKSSIFFSPNTPIVDRRTFLNDLGVVEATNPGNYIGLPLAGAIDDIKSQARSYWWFGKQNSRGWAMVTWDKICQSKKFGGMGFRDLRLFNIALLGNQIWRLIQDEHSSAFKAKEALKDGFFWRVGMNSKARIFEDNWGDASPIRWNERYMDHAEQPVRVADFMIPGCARWDEPKVVGVLRTEDVSPSMVADGIWNAVAKAKVLPKIRIFGWRICHEAIPVGSKIKQANLGDGVYPLCLWSTSDDVVLRRLHCWIKPTQDEVKINVDGAYCKDSRVAVVGIVARDSHGMVIGGLAKKIDPPFTAESTEAVAFIEGIRMASENGWNNAIIEGDAISIV
ncbi:hypothetical protein F3Y22_tig00110338pilonHSYRG00172 [Hibiscus syriacus]|uniref:RNase H type-1 domain-containing protein n=1 Tax=Hibiscus syriacus TaxID=106335 RepID=A0A6A3AXJ2_HIBSY|nr:hypothetical protein F3Y22_tig00110338pilonHSYRG00172 [Hibiscus syriacus]